MRTYVTHVYRVLREALNCTHVEHILALSRHQLADAVVQVNRNRKHQQRLCRIAINHFLHKPRLLRHGLYLGSVVLADHPMLAQRLYLRSKDLHNTADDGGGDDHPAEFAVSNCGPARDHFTQAEMNTLLNLPTLSLRDRVMLHIMAETGLRRRAVSWLLVECVFDRCAGECLPVSRALEKGLVTRQFVLSQHTASLVKQYIQDEHPGAQYRWLFPSSKKGHVLPITPSVVNNVLLRACRLANICGTHTHSHERGVFCGNNFLRHGHPKVCGVLPDAGQQQDRGRC